MSIENASSSTRTALNLDCNPAELMPDSRLQVC
jgi:hypothetical protein